jgi:hypothetical protein
VDCFNASSVNPVAAECQDETAILGFNMELAEEGERAGNAVDLQNIVVADRISDKEFAVTEVEVIFVVT